jgi:hypothetical protein
LQGNSRVIIKASGFFPKYPLLSELQFLSSIHENVGGICYNSDNFFRPRDRLIEMTKDPIIQGTETDKGLFLRKGDIHDNENGTIFFSTEE